MSSATLAKPATGFQALGLSASLLAALERVDYREPTPIQAALIPKALEGRDIIGQAQTGTGKTAAFLLPFLESWRDDNRPGPQALILGPTRELVMQVGEEASRLVPSKHCRVVPIYGGQRIRTQLTEMRKGFTIAIGTPGRVIDHLRRGSLSLQSVRYVVLDEADRMLDIGFRPDIERILRRCPSQRQTLLLSATVPPPVLRLTHRYMVDPLHINVSPSRVTVDCIKQYFFTVDEGRKFELLLRVMREEKPRQCIIFCQRKRSAEELFHDLREEHERVAVMHGDLPQPLRERIMQAFRDGKVTCLVATDVVGRGIDVNNISHIFNYDVPEDPENYVHRIGRTGRMGADGVAIAFITPDQGHLLTDIEVFINKQLQERTIPGFRAYKPRPAAAEKPFKSAAPIFGRRTKKYSNRL